jgi:hypothetical protein
MTTASKKFPEAELAWFKRVINFRMLQTYTEAERAEQLNLLPAAEQNLLRNASQIIDLVPPDLSDADCGYTRLVVHYELNGWERLAFLIALMPHLQPRLLDVFTPHAAQYGGVKGAQHHGFLPTGETILHLLSGSDLDMRLALLKLFDPDHVFKKGNLLTLQVPPRGEPELSGQLIVSREALDLVTRGYQRPPDFGNDFPAKRIITEMTWEDLVLSAATQRQVEEVKIWMRNREKLATELGLGKRMKPGYKILFHGSPGTGKTLTACLLGQFTGKHVFRIDLSMVVSKYIGETEKNLAKVFDQAEHSDWILFFDEADALFGSRTKVSSSHDRYANQEVSYLLQRIEDYNGIVILASNMKSNIDDAFMRRFSSVVHFPFPKSEERLQLWKKAIPEKLTLSVDVDMKKIADRYEMSGANITNIIAWCALMALEKGDMIFTEGMLREGIARELAKEGRTI